MDTGPGMLDQADTGVPEIGRTSCYTSGMSLFARTRVSLVMTTILS